MLQKAAVWLFLLLGLTALIVSHDFVGAPCVSNDSVQYLDAAQHLTQGDCFCTTVAHFDEQVAVGHMPIPFTHFAPGYPLLIAGLMKLGVAAPVAGYLISAFSYLLSIALFWYIGLALGASVWALGALGLLWVANSGAILGAAFVATESLFTAVFLAIAALILAHINSRPSRPAILLLIGVLAGALYAVRYPGLFVVPVVAAYLIWRCWQDRRTAPWALAGLAAAAAVCLTIMLRNSRLTGSWRGGFSSGKGHSVKFILVESIKAFYHLVFGDRVVAHLTLWTILFAVSLLAAILLAFRAWRAYRPASVPAHFGVRLAWLAALAGVYLAGIVYASMHSIAADLARYYFPVYPLLLAVLAAVSLARQPLEQAVLAVLAMAVLAIHSRSLLAPPPIPLTAEVHQVFVENVQPGVSLEDWLTTHLSSKDVLLAANGQAVHYLLDRPVVAVIAPLYTDRRSDEAAFHSLMDQFGARYLLLFPGSKVDQEQDDIPFLHSLAAGGPAPSWLTPAVHSKHAALYECATCVKLK